MIRHIHIRDFVLIDSLDLELDPGMTVLTGETGAGKSILVDAIGMVLGDRADSAAVRHGAKQAEITVTLDVSGSEAVRGWLAEQALDTEEECILRRIIGADGRSRAFLNGSPATLQSLRELGEMLVDIHGQHAHQSLARRDVQRGLLDSRAGHDALLAETAACHARFTEFTRRLASLSGDADARLARIEILRFQTEELRALDPEEGEYAALDGEQQRLAHAGQLIGTASDAYEALDGGDEGAVLPRIHRITQDIVRAADHDAALKPVAELLDSAGIQLGEAADVLNRYRDRIELDPERLAFVEERLSATYALARKHRARPETLPALRRELDGELGALEDRSCDREGLEREAAAAHAAFLDAARRLSGARRQAAARLAEAVTGAMQTLGMQGGIFEISVEADETDSHAWGIDRIEFRVSANPGIPAEPLSRVASGGELSRISLAVQIICAGGAGIPTLIFDEVDAGIGGGIAEIVGRHLRTLGESRQVLCVTHLPQVAAQAHHHLRVGKQKGETATRTLIESLAGKARTEEVARMLGGVEITARTRAHAKELLQAGAMNG